MRYDFSETETVKSSFRRIGRVQAVLYENRKADMHRDTAVLVMHSDSDYLTFSAGIELAQRGYVVLCANTESAFPMFLKMLSVKDCIEYLKSLPGIEKIVLFGHSGGATLMSAYQNVAQTGGGQYRGSHMIMSLTERMPALPAADGLMLIDPNWGNGAMTVFSIDPALTDPNDPNKIDSKLDLFNPENGFDPAGSHYTDDFIMRFQKAQGKRMNELVAYAADRLERIENGRGIYEDDEPLLIPGADGNFMNNKLYAQDPRLFSCTKGEYILLHAGGFQTVEVIHTVRGPQNDRCMRRSYRDGLLKTTVREFLDAKAVKVMDDYHYDESSVYGIDWDSSYCCTTGNVKGVTVPLLVMGMTGGWEFACAEGIYERAASTDKTIAFVEGATHMYCPERGETRYGDTLRTTYDYIASWLSTAKL